MIRSFQGITPRIDPSVFIAETAVIIGDVAIGAKSSIWYNVVIRGDVNRIRIGERTNIQDQCTLHVTHSKGGDDPGAPLIIGNDVTVGHGVTLHGCTIADNAFIGMQAIVMDKAQVGEGALIGARALVTEGTIIPPHTLWIGSPARQQRELTQEERKRLLASSANYTSYAEVYRLDTPV
jgi:carbonic anhydrase/acetyltransferase-like protein (isoleucine patch superfamily)